VISQLAARKLVLSQVEIELANLHRHVAQGEREGQFRQLQLRAADLAALIATGESRKLQLEAEVSALRAKVEQAQTLAQLHALALEHVTHGEDLQRHFETGAKALGAFIAEDHELDRVARQVREPLGLDAQSRVLRALANALWPALSKIPGCEISIEMSVSMTRGSAALTFTQAATRLCTQKKTE
jgi:hypothetical protein